MAQSSSNSDIEIEPPVSETGKFTFKCTQKKKPGLTTKQCTVQIVKGDITSETSDVIVHPTGTYIKLTGGIGQSLSQKGGTQFFRECEGAGYIDEIRFTNPGQLKCKKVAHMNIWKYTSDNQWMYQKFYDYVKWKLNCYEYTTEGWNMNYFICLKQVEESNYKSISFPAIGTGKGGIPINVSAVAFLQALEQFMNQHHRRLAEIRVVIKDDTQFAHFQSVVSKYCDEKLGISRPSGQLASSAPPKELIQELQTMLMKKLDNIVGLQPLKDQLLKFSTTCAMNMIRQQKGIEVPKKVPVFLFTGNPGTGKTSIAAIIAEVLHFTNLTKRNELISVQREDLVAPYVGQTAPKTADVLDKARGATLLIDEVYRLVPERATSDFGPEALDTIMRVIEGDANTTTDRPAIIFAGYPKDMKRVLDSNPGLRRRITDRFVFQDYSISEIVEIICNLAKKGGYRITASNADIESKIRSTISSDVLPEHNAGLSTRIYTAAKMEADKRLGGIISAGTLDPTKSVLLTLNTEDFNEAIEFVKHHL